VPLTTLAREWGRIGCIGFGGPPAHIALLRRLCVEDRRWMEPDEFEDAIAAVNLLPGPASTQLAIYCAWRLRGTPGALLGGACFICPGLAVILALAALFLSGHPPLWVRGAAAGADAAVPAVALQAAASLVPASWRRADVAPEAAGAGAPLEAGRRPRLTAARARWVLWAGAGAAAGVASTPFLVFVLIGAGLLEAAWRLRASGPAASVIGPVVAAGRHGARLARARLAAGALAPAGLGALVWVAFKVGALSYGGGFVIIPLMQHDAVVTYHWMTGPQFLDAVALGQVTPGPVVQTVAVVGYAAAGVGGGLLAALVAFAPSFAFVLLGGRHFDRLRADRRVQGFFAGAGPAAIGAIAGASVPLARDLTHLWQVGLLGLDLVWLVVARRGVVSGIVGSALVGVVAALLGAPVPV
jgi:chromate transporter